MDALEHYHVTEFVSNGIRPENKQHKKTALGSAIYT